MYISCLNISANSVTLPKEKSPIILHCLPASLPALNLKMENLLGPPVAETLGPSRLLTDRENSRVLF